MSIFSVDMFGQVIGLFGTFFISYCFFMNVKGVWKHDDTKYLLVNMIGAILLLISLCIHFNLGSFVIELFWISVSLYGFHKKYKERKNA